MATISGNHVLILGSAMGLSEALYQQFDLGNLPVSHIPLEQLNWQQLADADAVLSKSKTTLVLNALPLDFSTVDASQWPHIQACNQWLVDLCKTRSIKLLQLSSCDVFIDNNKRAYDESEKPTPGSPLAQQLFDTEALLDKSLSQWILLRLARLINTSGDNVFTQSLTQLMASHQAEVDQSVRVAPVWLDDALRVTATMVRQLLAGADNWGVFHYGSADPCTEKEFVQQLCESLNEIRPMDPVDIVTTPVAEQKKTSGVLKCRRVRNNFGVHGRTWRQGLKARIQFWLDSHEKRVQGLKDQQESIEEKQIANQSENGTPALNSDAIKSESDGSSQWCSGAPG